MPLTRINRQSPEGLDVVHVINSPYLLTPIFGGQVAFMKAHGVQTAFVTSPGAELEAFALAEQVPICQTKIARTISPIRDALSIARLWSCIRRKRPQIIHAHTPKGGLIGMLAGALARVPVRIYHLHGMPLQTAQGLRRKLLWMSEWLSCRLAHRVFCVSHSIREIAVDHNICTSEKIFVLSKGSANGIDATGRFDPLRFDAASQKSRRSDLGIPDDAKVITFVGRLNRDKGIVELASAWRDIRRLDANARLLLIGPRDHKDSVPSDVLDQFEADPRVHLIGYQSDTAPLYSVTDVFVLPSYREGLPTVVLEAMAMALPIVATRIPGCVDVIDDGITGTLISPKSRADLVAAVLHYTKNPSIGKQHGRAARQHVLRNFRREQLWQETLKQYHELLARCEPRIAHLPTPEGVSQSLPKAA